jgi:ubiquinone/menaquinone biosynthesis C-methylase UbiE
VNYLEDYYGNYDEDARLGFRHNQVEFLTTMRYIERYLRPGANVLEIGAGTGRYSRTIADMAYRVEAVELLPHNIEIFEKQVELHQDIRVTQGNALDLDMFGENIFDITLLLGPMYHLYTETDKRKAIGEALRVTKPGGVVFVAYCLSDACLLADSFSNNKFSVSDYIERGKIDPVTFATKSLPEDIFELVRKDEIDDLMKSFRVERLHYVATDMITHFLRESLESMSDEVFDMYLKYHYAVCERPDMVGMTHHSLDVFRKI